MRFCCPDELSKSFCSDNSLYTTAEETKGNCLQCLVVPENSLTSHVAQWSELADALDRWGDLKKAMRIIALVLRFIKICRNKVKDSNNISVDILEYAKQKMIFCVQKKEFNYVIQQIKSQGQVSKKSLHKIDPFIDEYGLVRIKGRLEKSDLSFDRKHQIIIPRGHLSKLVIRFHHQFLKHAGVNSLITALREKYYIFGIRKECKSVVKECIFCRI